MTDASKVKGKKTAKTKGAVSPTSRRMSAEEWEEIKVKWRSGKFTLNQLSEIYKFSVVGIQRKLARHGVEKSSDAGMYEARIAEAKAAVKAEAAAQEEKELRGYATNAKKTILKLINGTLGRVAREMAKQLADAKPFHTISEDAKAAKEVSIMLRNMADTTDKVLPSADLLEDELPSLVVEEMSQQEINDLRAYNEDDESGAAA